MSKSSKFGKKKKKPSKKKELERLNNIDSDGDLELVADREAQELMELFELD